MKACDRPIKIAFFISPHGFGHAARSAAVIEALSVLERRVEIGIFTTVPKWFFEESLSIGFHYHYEITDLGLVQKTSLKEDLPRTAELLRRMLPTPAESVNRLARRLDGDSYDLIVSDISPLGLSVADHLGLPSVLIENFTWDWIYDSYVAELGEMAVFADIMRKIFALATIHIAAEPACRPVENALKVSPISRLPKMSRAEVRSALGISAEDAMVVLTMGGIEFDYNFLELMQTHPQAVFVVPGSAGEEVREGHLIRLPHHSRYYHPDLVHASDLVVGKIGYSTLAEVYDAGVAYAYVPRERFPESPILARFAETFLGARRISPSDFEMGGWLDIVKELIKMPTRRSGGACGAVQAAKIILATNIDEKSGLGGCSA